MEGDENTPQRCLEENRTGSSSKELITTGMFMSADKCSPNIRSNTSCHVYSQVPAAGGELVHVAMLQTKKTWCAAVQDKGVHLQNDRLIGETADSISSLFVCQNVFSK